MVAGLAYAESTSEANYTSSNPALQDWLNDQSYVQHSHDLDKEKKLTKTIGLDLQVYDSEAIEVVQVNEYNFDTYHTQIGAKVKVKLWNILTK